MTEQTKYPTSAFIAVTLLCNARCVMCDIWKHRGLDFLPPETYAKLPSSLRMVDITGGEPFLRPDLADVVRTVRAACPFARILITTNGFLHQNIKKQIDAILRADPNIAFRISLDGGSTTHGKIRRIPDAYNKAMHTIALLKQKKVKDIGIIYTLMKQNKKELKDVYAFCKKEQIHFSLNVVHDSPVYFGNTKTHLRPEPDEVKDLFDWLFIRQIQSLNPKDWAKAWLNMQLFKYMKTHRRPLPCGAGENFFYMDPFANIYMCHLKNWPIGNLAQHRFRDIWNSKARRNRLPLARRCHDCLITCTIKDEIAKKRHRVLGETLKFAAAAFYKGSAPDNKPDGNFRG